MNVKKATRVKELLLCLFFCCSLCLAETGTHHPAPEFEELFRRSVGWTGADGTYSLPVGDKTFWFFSDTFFGRVEEGRRVDSKMLNNSLIIQNKEELQFVEAPLFSDPSGTGWFWLMDVVRSGDSFEILLAHIVHDPKVWLNFRQDGCWYARFHLNAGRTHVVVEEYIQLPHFGTRTNELLTWGTALVNDSAWTYILGTHDQGPRRDLVVARVPRGHMKTPGTWRFWDGKNWVKDKWNSATLFSGASNESGVYPTRDGGYFYVGSNGGLDKAVVVGRYSPSITGPWGEEMLLRVPPEVGGSVIMYNAKSHPELSRDGRLLVSYNVNTTDLEEVMEKADIYRPRFFWWTPPHEGWLPR